MVNITLTAAVRDNLYNLKHTNQNILETNNRLNSGKKVSKMEDDPALYYRVKALRERAQTFTEIKEGITSSISMIKATNTGIITLEDNMKAIKSNLENMLDATSKKEFNAYRSSIFKTAQQMMLVTKDATYGGISYMNSTLQSKDVKFSPIRGRQLHIQGLDLRASKLGLVQYNLGTLHNHDAIQTRYIHTFMAPYKIDNLCNAKAVAAGIMPGDPRHAAFILEMKRGLKQFAGEPRQIPNSAYTVFNGVMNVRGNISFIGLPEKIPGATKMDNAGQMLANNEHNPGKISLYQNLRASINGDMSVNYEGHNTKDIMKMFGLVNRASVMERGIVVSKMVINFKYKTAVADPAAAMRFGRYTMVRNLTVKNFTNHNLLGRVALANYTDMIGDSNEHQIKTGFYQRKNIMNAMNDAEYGLNVLKINAIQLNTSLGILETRKDFNTKYTKELSEGADEMELIDTTREIANYRASSARQKMGLAALNIASQQESSLAQLLQ